MEVKTKIILILFILSIFLAWIALAPDFLIHNSDIRNIEMHSEFCKEYYSFECIENCEDGFNSRCYFDSNLYSDSDFDSGPMGFSEEEKDKCFGIYVSAVCGNCENQYYLHGEKVSCGEFFESYQNENMECSNCIKTIDKGCC